MNLLDKGKVMVYIISMPDVKPCAFCGKETQGYYLDKMGIGHYICENHFKKPEKIEVECPHLPEYLQIIESKLETSWEQEYNLGDKCRTVIRATKFLCLKCKERFALEWNKKEGVPFNRATFNPN